MPRNACGRQRLLREPGAAIVTTPSRVSKQILPTEQTFQSAVAPPRRPPKSGAASQLGGAQSVHTFAVGRRSWRAPLRRRRGGGLGEKGRAVGVSPDRPSPAPTERRPPRSLPRRLAHGLLNRWHNHLDTDRRRTHRRAARIGPRDLPSRRRHRTARHDLTRRGVVVTAIRHKSPIDPGTDPQRRDPDGNTWVIQEIGFTPPALPSAEAKR